MTKSLMGIVLILTWMLFCGISPPSADHDVEWVLYTTFAHTDMGVNSGFSARVYHYLKFQRKLEEPALSTEFKRWYPTNLGHVFEKAALASYGIPKNQIWFNGRIPDGVQDGMLDQISQFTHYPSSTFIEVKYMSDISWLNPRIKSQIQDMIDFLSSQERHQTYSRYISASFTPDPGKASEEDMAILVFITPFNCRIHQDIIQFANKKHVLLYQMKMLTNYGNRMQIKLSKPDALTRPSRHFFGHRFALKPAIMPWDSQLIDPDTGFPVYE